MPYEEPLFKEKIEFFASKIDINILFNNKGTKYKQLNLKDLNLTDSDKLSWLIKENMLLKRPIVEYDKDKVLCAFDEDIYQKKLLFLN